MERDDEMGIQTKLKLDPKVEGQIIDAFFTFNLRSAKHYSTSE